MKGTPQGKSSTKVINTIIAIIAIAMAVYHMVMTQYFLEMPVLWQNTHLIFGLLIVFLVSMKQEKKRWWPLTIFFILLSLIFTGYVKIEYERLSEYLGWPAPMDTVVGIIVLIVALEGGRRGQGLVFTIIAFVFLGYGFLGHLLPYPLWHARFPPARLINMLTLCFSGVYGSMLAISAKYIFLFMLFGGLLEASGAAESFMPLARALGRKFAGGAAHTAVVSSALVGMVTGSGMANAAITGGFTIPTMKRAGYTPEQAAAIEAASATGGQVMPPVMGAAAFVMVGFTGIPYSRIMLAAIIPAIIYFLSIGIGVQLMAMKGHYTVPKEEVDWKMVFLRAPVFIIPLIVVGVLLTVGYTPMFTAFYAVLSVFVISIIIGLIKKEARIPLNRWVNGAVYGAVAGARIGVGIACIGIVVGVVTFSGLGPKFTILIRMLSAGSVPIALFLTMILALILGCGIPVTAAYILVAVAVVPGIVRMGVGLLPAHFFAFYYSCIGAVSPPIAGCCVVTASMAGASYLKTGVKATGLVAIGFIVPFLCIWNPFMLWYPSALGESALLLTSIVAGTLGLHVIIHRQYLARVTLLEGLLFLIATLGLFAYAFKHDYRYVIIGWPLFILLTLFQWKKRKVEQRAAVKADPSV
jgi:TRAP transporter 4TM/12TM fusion protein